MHNELSLITIKATSTILLILMHHMPMIQFKVGTQGIWLTFNNYGFWGADNIIKDHR